MGADRLRRGRRGTCRPRLSSRSDPGASRGRRGWGGIRGECRSGSGDRRLWGIPTRRRGGAEAAGRGPDRGGATAASRSAPPGGREAPAPQKLSPRGGRGPAAPAPGAGSACRGPCDPEGGWWFSRWPRPAASARRISSSRCGPRPASRSGRWRSPYPDPSAVPGQRDAGAWRRSGTCSRRDTARRG